MTDITIPPEALEAAARAVHDIDRKIVGSVGEDWPTWEELSPADRQRRLHRARAACLAMLKNWPGMSDIPSCEADGTRYPRVIHLPITQENTNAEA